MLSSNIKIVDCTIEILLQLEHVFQEKIKCFQESTIGTTASFSSLIQTMKEEQEEELKILQLVIKINTKLKQRLCSHPKKDHDACGGVKYCMNCNITLKK